jgi:NAD(P)-dependent dehydrogenase (short-subunit alcohol dehydrogenase family)
MAGSPVTVGWPLALMLVLDKDAYGVPLVRRIPLWVRIVALVAVITRGIKANRRRALLRRQLGGQRVLITGGASGLGLLLAHRCARAGACVVIFDLDHAACMRALDEIRRTATPPRGGKAPAIGKASANVVARAVDVTNRLQVYETMEALRREVGEMDVVVLNAGVVGGRPLLLSDDATMARTMDVNCTSHLWLLKVGISAQLQRGVGAWVCTAPRTCVCSS